MADSEFTLKEKSMLELLVGDQVCIPSNSPNYLFWYQIGFATLLTIMLIIVLILPLNTILKIVLFWIFAFLLDMWFKNQQKSRPPCSEIDFDDINTSN